MDLDTQSNNSRKKRRRVQKEEEEGLEDLPRLWNDTKKDKDDQDLHYLLPLKDEHKLIPQKPVKLEKGDICPPTLKSGTLSHMTNTINHMTLIHEITKLN